MKGQKWDDTAVSFKENLESPPIFHEEGAETNIAERKPKSHLTELRRRIEERLDSKRIALEYEDFEDNS